MLCLPTSNDGSMCPISASSCETREPFPKMTIPPMPDATNFCPNHSERKTVPPGHRMNNLPMPYQYPMIA